MQAPCRNEKRRALLDVSIFFVDNDCQNFMKTRSGLTIKTVPSGRRSNSKSNLKTDVQAAQPSLPENGTKAQTPQRTSDDLSFVTRYHLLRKGIKLDYFGFRTEHHKDTTKGDEACNADRNGDNFNPGGDISLQLLKFGLHSKHESEGKPGGSSSDVFFSVSNFASENPVAEKSVRERSTTGLSCASIDLDSPFTPTQKKMTFPTASLKVSSQIIHSRTRVLLATSSGWSSNSFRLGDSTFVPAQLSTGENLLFKNIPILVVNQIVQSHSPSKPNLFNKNNPKPDVKRKSTKTNLDASVSNAESKESVKTDTPGNVVEDCGEESSDTCSQGSQDSSISEFDLSVFQMESHDFCKDANGNQIHKCKICARVFTVFAAYKSHVNTHVKANNRCHICGKIFSRSWLLKGHMRTHTGEGYQLCTGVSQVPSF